jgi:hypothetical protein
MYNDNNFKKAPLEWLTKNEKNFLKQFRKTLFPIDLQSKW